MLGWGRDVAAGLASGLAAGGLSGLFGIGGGIILVPILGLTLGLTQHQAQGVSLASLLLPTGLPAVLHFRRRGVTLQGWLAAALTLGFLPASWAGARIATRLPSAWLQGVFAILLLALAFRTWRRSAGAAAPVLDRPRLGPGRVAAPGLAVGAAAGLASGLLGIGGGILVVPLLGLLLGLSQLEAQVTSLLFMLAPIGLPAVLVYARTQGGLPWLLMAAVAGGFVLGAAASARIATRLRGDWLRRGFALLLALTAAAFLRRIVP